MIIKKIQPEIYQFFFAAKNEPSMRSLFKKFFDHEKIFHNCTKAEDLLVLSLNIF